MTAFGPIAFLSPLFLFALAALPVIWWLIRTNPPAPRRITFPAIRLLFGLAQHEETTARTPIWLLIARMLLAALIIVALARPVMNPERVLAGSGPLVLVVDNGWAAAPRWNDRRTAMNGLIDRAERAGRGVVLMPTAAPADGGAPEAVLLPPGDAKEKAGTLVPVPWPVDRMAALAALDALTLDGSVNVVWLSDGLADDDDTAFAEALQHRGQLTVIIDPPGESARLLEIDRSTGLELAVIVTRPTAGAAEERWLRATDPEGQIVTRVSAVFEPESRTARAVIDLPPQRRNDIAQLTLEGASGSGSVILIDNRWRRRPVGLVSGLTQEKAQALLSDLYYLERAIAPYHEVSQGEIDTLLAAELSVLILADVGQLTLGEQRAIENWVRAGGVLIRFAGPRLAERDDRLLPTALRRGERALGGALSWAAPARIAPFDADSPFNGLEIPPDVVVNRQVLAEPSIELAERTWARLADGTPLITGKREEDGWIVLVHTTANTDWSNLALSGLYVEMLRRLVDLASGAGVGTGDEDLPPVAILDGFGRLGAPDPGVQPVAAADWPGLEAGPAHPPGYYGREGERRAFNLTDGIDGMEPLGPLPAGVSQRSFDGTGEIDLMPWFLLAAMILILADGIVSLMLRGLIRARAGAMTAGLLLGLFALPAGDGWAQSDPFSPDALAKRAALETRLAYVLTGIPQVDDVSLAGLRGLGTVLTRRTSVEPATPMGVDIETDELSVFPLLYWPVTAGQPAPSDAAVARLNNYLRNGGMIVFDTRENDPGRIGTVGRDPVVLLRRLVRGLDIRPLTPVPAEHVLTKSFYLLQDFPGRWRGGNVWVEEDPQVNDGVSAVVVGGHDWAGAWAVDERGAPMFAVVPGGEQQRETAFRFGVNLVMYAMTGNYKADQVHIPAIMERLGL